MQGLVEESLSLVVSSAYKVALAAWDPYLDMAAFADDKDAVVDSRESLVEGNSSVEIDTEQHWVDHMVMLYKVM